MAARGAAADAAEADAGPSAGGAGPSAGGAAALAGAAAAGALPRAQAVPVAAAGAGAVRSLQKPRPQSDNFCVEGDTFPLNHRCLAYVEAEPWDNGKPSRAEPAAWKWEAKGVCPHARVLRFEFRAHFQELQHVLPWYSPWLALW